MRLDHGLPSEGARCAEARVGAEGPLHALGPVDGDAQLEQDGEGPGQPGTRGPSAGIAEPPQDPRPAHRAVGLPQQLRDREHGGGVDIQLRAVLDGTHGEE